MAPIAISLQFICTMSIFYAFQGLLSFARLRSNIYNLDKHQKNKSSIQSVQKQIRGRFD